MIRNPLAPFRSGEYWWSLIYLASYLVAGPALFTGAVVMAAVAAVPSVSWIGLPLLAAAPVVIRGLAEVERIRARLIDQHIAHRYRAPGQTGLITQIRTRWTDPATWRDIGYLVALFPVLAVAHLAVLSVCGFLAFLTSLPLWYWSVPVTLPDGTRTHGMVLLGSLHVTDLSVVIPLCLAGVAGLILTSPLLVAAARLQSAVAARILGPYTDPLHTAKTVLTTPGPLALAAEPPRA